MHLLKLFRFRNEALIINHYYMYAAWTLYIYISITTSFYTNFEDGHGIFHFIFSSQNIHYASIFIWENYPTYIFLYVKYIQPLTCCKPDINIFSTILFIRKRVISLYFIGLRLIISTSELYRIELYIYYHIYILHIIFFIIFEICTSCN